MNFTDPKFWTSPFFDATTRGIVSNWIEERNPILNEIFYRFIEFGTAGMRGICGIGSARINIYTVSIAIHALCQYLVSRYRSEPISVVIGYDNRMTSPEFASQSAKIFSAYGIKAYLSPSPIATPLLSFAIRHLQAQAGIMITASHNPKEYNGLKVYGSHGGQVIAPEDGEIIKYVKSIHDISTLPLPSETAHTTFLDQAVIQAYYSIILSNRIPTYPERASIVYSPLHGVGGLFIPSILEKAGYKPIYVESQMKPDGQFPTLPSPNPENPDSFNEAVALLEAGGDLAISTDPDADRIGAAFLHNGKIHYLSGNQIGAILGYMLLQHSTAAHKGIISTVVSSPLIQSIAKQFGAECTLTLTGFKYIAQVMDEWKRGGVFSFILGFEESQGYLSHTYTRDKDGLCSTLLLADIASILKHQKRTFVDLLEEIYEKFGLFAEQTHFLSFPGSTGLELMNSRLHALRGLTSIDLNNYKYLYSIDYLSHPNEQLRTNMLEFHFEGGYKVMIRPSGTEPKLKLYGFIEGKKSGHYIYELRLLQEKLGHFLQAVSQLFQ